VGSIIKAILGFIWNLVTQDKHASSA